jgi:hypothetical protein
VRCLSRRSGEAAVAVSKSIDFGQRILAWYDQRLKSEKVVTTQQQR